MNSSFIFVGPRSQISKCNIARLLSKTLMTKKEANISQIFDRGQKYTYNVQSKKSFIIDKKVCTQSQKYGLKTVLKSSIYELHY